MTTVVRAVFFDQDGVIVDTERDGHRVAFNETFRQFGFDFEWGVEEYHELLQIAGGKERIRHYLRSRSIATGLAPEEEDELIRRMHRYKTERFIALIESGKLPLRPGVKRFMQEVKHAGLISAICTTSNQEAARAIVDHLLADVRPDFVLAGDVVRKKKPDPEIYQLALERAGIEPDECIVVEDSRNGLLAAKALGMKVIVTVNPYTEREDLSEADLIVTCLGDAGGEQCRLIRGGEGLHRDGLLHLDDVVRYFGASLPARI